MFKQIKVWLVLTTILSLLALGSSAARRQQMMPDRTQPSRER